MTKSIVVIVFICSVSLIAGSCSQSSHVLKKDPNTEVMHQTLTLKPGGSDEECIELKPGMVFDYDFDASDFVNFNIHYHAEDEVKYPVYKKGILYGKGSIDPQSHDFYSPDQEFYCLMWDNMSDVKVEVSFTCVLKGKPPETIDGASDGHHH